MIRVLVVFLAFAAGVRVERWDGDHHNPHRWQGGDGPETVCVYEDLADGGGKGARWIEQWTVCEPGEEP